MQRKSTNGSPANADPSAQPDRGIAPASGLLARVARTLSSHWKRSLAAAVGVLVLLVLAAGAADKASDDFTLPGTESQEAIDLFQAHSPAFGGVDSTLVFTVDEGKVSDPGAQGGDRGRAREGPRARRRRAGGESVRAGRPGLRGRAPGVGRRALLDRSRDDRQGGRRGADRGRRDRRARGSGRGARRPDRPGGRAVAARRRAHRRGRRDRVAPPAVPLRGGDGRDAHRRAGRRRGGPDPAGRGVGTARPAHASRRSSR